MEYFNEEPINRALERAALLVLYRKHDRAQTQITNYKLRG